MDSKILSHTVPGLYETLRRSATTIGLNLSLEAHAYLNQEYDEFFIREFVREKHDQYYGADNYIRELGTISHQELENRMSCALSLCYFYTLPVEKLKRAVSFLTSHSVSGRTILERIILRSAKESLAARLGGFSLQSKGLQIAFVLFLLTAYTAAILHNFTASAIFFALSALVFVIRTALHGTLKKEFFRKTVRAVNPGAADDLELRRAIADMLGRFYPGFEW
jgi:hypothetical protein